MKECSVCRTIKHEDEFYQRDGKCIAACKQCTYVQNRVYRDKNKDKISQYFKDRYQRDKEKLKIQQKFRYEQKKSEIIAKSKIWKEANKDKMREWFRIREKDKLKDPSYRLSSCISHSIYMSLKSKKSKRKWEVLCGYSLQQLKDHLEKQFKDGMTWENYGKWHVDHIIPKSVFNYTSPEHPDFKKCWSLKNLRPMWAKENLRKSNKLSKPFQPCLALSMQ